MAGTTEDGKERARLAQQRSRAKRKRAAVNLQAKADYLTLAVAELVENSLQLSDAAIYAIRSNSYDGLGPRLKPFINKTLAIARKTLATDENEGAGRFFTCDTGEVRDAVDNLEFTKALSRQQAPVVVQPSLSSAPLRPAPATSYGLLPSLSGYTSPPLDVLDDLNPYETPFAALLFWNTMAFARVALEHPSSAVTKGIFEYAMPFTNAVQQRNQITRRLRFKPTSVRLIRALPDAALLNDEEMNQRKLDLETQSMQEDHIKVSQAMLNASDSMTLYLDAAKVEHRLVSHWGIDVLSLTANKNDLLCRHDMRRTLWSLIRATKCLGNKPGFPLGLVDVCAREFLIGSSMT